MKKILLAGATGYLGEYILKQLIKQEYSIRVIVRDPAKLKTNKANAVEVVKAELTNSQSIENCCEKIDTVISTVGITRQKDGLTYMDVDYQANMNLLKEATKKGVRRFIYISVLDGEKLKYLKICEAKEKFVDELKKSGLDFCIVRPNGFFSDMSEFFDMAQKGRIYLFGKGKFKGNPIHGEDLAKICVGAIQTHDKEICAGGPETLTHNQIADIAFSVSGKKKRISYMPDWLRKLILSLLRTFTNSKVYGPIEFFMTVLAMDLIAPEYGDHTLKAYFEEIKQQH